MKKKTIKKPKFWKFLLPRLIPALLIALYIDIAVYTNIESVNRMWFSGDLTDYDTIDLITAELSISKENGTEFPDRWTTQLVSRLSYDESGRHSDALFLRILHPSLQPTFCGQVHGRRLSGICFG